MTDVLRAGGYVSRGNASTRSMTHIILETAESAPEIAFFKVVTVLDLPCEQSTAEWAVWVQKEVMAEISRRRSSRVGHDSNAEFFTGGDH